VVKFEVADGEDNFCGSEESLNQGSDGIREGSDFGGFFSAKNSPKIRKSAFKQNSGSCYVDSTCSRVANGRACEQVHPLE